MNETRNATRGKDMSGGDTSNVTPAEMDRAYKAQQGVKSTFDEKGTPRVTGKESEEMFKLVNGK